MEAHCSIVWKLGWRVIVFSLADRAPACWSKGYGFESHVLMNFFYSLCHSFYFCFSLNYSAMQPYTGPFQRLNSTNFLSKRKQNDAQLWLEVSMNLNTANKFLVMVKHKKCCNDHHNSTDLNPMCCWTFSILSLSFFLFLFLSLNCSVMHAYAGNFPWYNTTDSP